VDVEVKDTSGFDVLHSGSSNVETFITCLEDCEGMVTADHDVKDLVALGLHDLLVSCDDT
jgi:hypothetical protein